MALFAGGAGGEIERGDGELADLDFDPAPFGIDMIPAQPDGDLVRPVATHDRHAAVAFFLGVEIIGVIALRVENIVIQLVLLRLGLLDADHIRLLAFHPFEEPLALGSANAVEIGGNHSEHHTYPVTSKRCMIHNLNNEIPSPTIRNLSHA